MSSGCAWPIIRAESQELPILRDRKPFSPVPVSPCPYLLLSYQNLNLSPWWMFPWASCIPSLNRPCAQGSMSSIQPHTIAWMLHHHPTSGLCSSGHPQMLPVPPSLPSGYRDNQSYYHDCASKVRAFPVLSGRRDSSLPRVRFSALQVSTGHEVVHCIGRAWGGPPGSLRSAGWAWQEARHCTVS